MNPVRTTLLLLTAFLAVFAQASFEVPRRLLGVQLDFLTPLVVYTALRGDLLNLTLTAVCGGLWLDALSANPLGVSVLPLFVPALLVHTQRDLILRDQRFAQAVLGAGGSVAFVLLSLFLLLTMGRTPSVGWGILWVLVATGASGALLVPAYGAMFSSLEGVLFYRPRKRPSFDPRRQIKRDRHLS